MESLIDTVRSTTHSVDSHMSMIKWGSLMLTQCYVHIEYMYIYSSVAV